MTEYEIWSLCLTGVGQTIFIGSIIYAARAFSLSKNENERKIKIETIDCLNALDLSLKEAYQNIHEVFGHHRNSLSLEKVSKEFNDDIGLQVDLHRIFNSFEQVSSQINLYDIEIIKDNFISKQYVWHMFKDYRDFVRTGKQPKIWLHAEAFFNSLERNKAIIRVPNNEVFTRD